MDLVYFPTRSPTDEHLECTGCSRKTWKWPCLLSWHLVDCVWLANDPRSLCILLAWLYLCKYFIFANLKMWAGKEKLTSMPKDWFHASVSVIFNSAPSCLHLLPSWRGLWGRTGTVGSWENLLPMINLSVLLERNVYCSYSSRVENMPARTPGKLDSDPHSPWCQSQTDRNQSPGVVLSGLSGSEPLPVRPWDSLKLNVFIDLMNKLPISLTAMSMSPTCSPVAITTPKWFVYACVYQALLLCGYGSEEWGQVLCADTTSPHSHVMASTLSSLAIGTLFRPQCLKWKTFLASVNLNKPLGAQGCLLVGFLQHMQGRKRADGGECV